MMPAESYRDEIANFQYPAMLDVGFDLMAIDAVNVSVRVLRGHNARAVLVRALPTAELLGVTHPLVHGQMGHGILDKGIGLQNLSFSQRFDHISLGHLTHFAGPLFFTNSVRPQAAITARSMKPNRPNHADRMPPTHVIVFDLGQCALHNSMVLSRQAGGLRRDDAATQ
jgi:hypothetical protein